MNKEKLKKYLEAEISDNSYYKNKYGEQFGLKSFSYIERKKACEVLENILVKLFKGDFDDD